MKKEYPDILAHNYIPVNSVSVKIYIFDILVIPVHQYPMEMGKKCHAV